MRSLPSPKAAKQLIARLTRFGPRKKAGLAALVAILAIVGFVTREWLTVMITAAGLLALLLPVAFAVEMLRWRKVQKRSLRLKKGRSDKALRYPGVPKNDADEVPWRPSCPIIHSCHHKVGTVWFGDVLRHMSNVTAAPFERIERDTRMAPLAVGFYLDSHSLNRPGPADTLRGSHMVRDPRDIVVSGYRYHLWSSEKWLRLPNPNFDGKSYQERLNELPIEEGLAMEITRTRRLFSSMREWDYDDDRILELRYEDVFGDDEKLWNDLMTHWGMQGQNLERGVEIGVFHSFKNVKARAAARGEEKKHLSTGTPLQWQEKFTPALTELIEVEAGDLITKLGYR